MFARPGRCVSQIGPGPNILIPANSIWSPYPDASSLPAVNLSRPAMRDGTELVNYGAGFKQIPHTNSMTSAC
jgi:hypothetical protein